MHIGFTNQHAYEALELLREMRTRVRLPRIHFVNFQCVGSILGLRLGREREMLKYRHICRVVCVCRERERESERERERFN